MSAPTRYKNGVTNVHVDDPLAYLKVPDPSQMHLYFNDFDTYVAADWTITTTEAGTGSATEAVTDEDGGVLLITNDDADDDADFFQLAAETFKFVAGKKLMFKARFKVSDATQSDFVMGLQITDTAPLDVTDGVFFQKDDGDTNLDFHVEKDSTATSATGIHTVTTGYMELAFYYNGVDAIKYYVDGTHVGTAAVTNLPDDEDMTISFGIQNGEAAAKTMSVDYILVAKER